MTLAFALDLGSSQIKTGVMDDLGHLGLLNRVPAPKLKKQGLMRTAPGNAYYHSASSLLKGVDLVPGTPFGISCQRSSFLLWNRRTGRPVTPVISWQDLRASSWCQRHQDLEKEIRKITGLPLSPHYIGPKLASLFECEPHLADMAHKGQLLFGTLETHLLWHWSDRAIHHTDPSMAARSLLMEMKSGGWSTRCLEKFGIPATLLPKVGTPPEGGFPCRQGFSVWATGADQAMGSAPVFRQFPQCAFINAGTGIFTMRYSKSAAPDGFLTVPSLDKNRFLWEGPINAGAALLKGYNVPFKQFLGAEDAYPDHFAIADAAGLGAPHWRSDLGNTFSINSEDLSFLGRKQILFESLLFRIRETLEKMFTPDQPDKVILAGGLAGRHDFSRVLAAFLPVPVFILKEREMGLWGATWMAAGCLHNPRFKIKKLPDSWETPYLEAKYHRWKAWVAEILAA